MFSNCDHTQFPSLKMWKNCIIVWETMMKVMEQCKKVEMYIHCVLRGQYTDYPTYIL
jgi:hypothetical protein